MTTTGSLLLNRGRVLNALKNIENEYKYNQHNQNETKERSKTRQQTQDFIQKYAVERSKILLSNIILFAFKW